jgi:DnaK suppressor protein
VTEHELAYHRKKLEEEKAEYLETLSTSIESAKGEEFDQQRIGRLSRMDAIQSQAILQAANRRIQLEVQQIDLALKRIEQGTYGICQTCSQDIPFARLDAVPSTLQCIACARRNG